MERHEQQPPRTNEFGFAMSAEFEQLISEFNGELFEQIISWSPNGIAIMDYDGQFMFTTQRTAEMKGHNEASELIGTNFVSLFAQEDQEAALDILERARQEPQVDKEYEIPRHDGGNFPVQVSVAAMSGPGEQPEAFVALIKDISEIKSREQEYRDMLDLSADGILIADENARILYANESALKMSGYTKEELLGKTALEVVQLETDEEPLAIEEIVEGKTVRRERTALRKDGTTIPVDVSAKVMPNGKIMANIRDITERKELLETIKQQSVRDELTGLYNRRFYTETINHIVGSRQYPIGLFVFDLDGRLKETNDKHGHDAGNKLIKDAADILSTSFQRQGDTVCRIGGDEFAVIVTQTDEEAVAKLMERVKSNLKEGGVEASAGVAVTHDWSETQAEDIFRQADQKMYQDKSAKKQKNQTNEA